MASSYYFFFFTFDLQVPILIKERQHAKRETLTILQKKKKQKLNFVTTTHQTNCTRFFLGLNPQPFEFLIFFIYICFFYHVQTTNGVPYFPCEGIDSSLYHTHHTYTHRGLLLTYMHYYSFPAKEFCIKKIYICINAHLQDLNL